MGGFHLWMAAASPSPDKGCTSFFLWGMGRCSGLVPGGADESSDSGLPWRRPSCAQFQPWIVGNLIGYEHNGMAGDGELGMLMEYERRRSPRGPSQMALHCAAIWEERAWDHLEKKESVRNCSSNLVGSGDPFFSLWIPWSLSETGRLHALRRGCGAWKLSSPQGRKMPTEDRRLWVLWVPAACSWSLQAPGSMDVGSHVELLRKKKVLILSVLIFLGIWISIRTCAATEQSSVMGAANTSGCVNGPSMNCGRTVPQNLPGSLNFDERRVTTIWLGRSQFLLASIFASFRIHLGSIRGRTLDSIFRSISKLPL